MPPNGSTSVRRTSAARPPPSVSATSSTRFDQRLGDAEARARDRVVGGLLVRGEPDALGEGGGHGVAMRGDEGDVATREPEVQRERDEERGAEQRGKGGCGHDRAGRAGALRSVRE